MNRRSNIPVYATWLLLGIGWYTLHGLGQMNHALLVDNAAQIKASSDHDEKLILDFMSRTVDRWDKLQKDNPWLNVPRVDEPIDKPHLSDGEMQRPPQPLAPLNR